MSKRFLIEPTDLKTANEIVARLHRHSEPVGVSIRQVIARDRASGQVVGTGILGRPVSLILDDGFTLEVSRTATDGTEHACSAILGALAREARKILLRGNPVYRLTTYTRQSESGASLRAAGWRFDAKHHTQFVPKGLGVERTIVPIQPKSWSNPSRPRPVREPGEPRLRWLKLLPDALDDEAAFKMGQAAAAAGALIGSNPFSYLEARADGSTQLVFVGDYLWEIWREGFSVGNTRAAIA
ncbi:XF1762 family protein [Microvirga massiliensis]|uniref:XF1762 family protein n=1 Tax=Microvirga massiliensis TaxID=1033741 RepID=UPI00069B6BC1|nr:XF1762 family protein [Microvirga massiliensis]